MGHGCEGDEGAHPSDRAESNSQAAAAQPFQTLLGVLCRARVHLRRSREAPQQQGDFLSSVVVAQFIVFARAGATSEGAAVEGIPE